MALKVFNLQCGSGHLFEGWFGSLEDYTRQRTDGLISCPLCQSTAIEKMPSAPHVSVGKGRELLPTPNAVPSSDGSVAAGAAELAQLQAVMLQKMREFVRSADNVGPRFAEEARLIHQGSMPERPIRGTATPEERAALTEEGIGYVALPDFLANDSLQ